jgi:hypothetical protein
MRTAEESLHDTLVESIDAQTPQIGSVVNDLGERVPEVRVLWARLELNQNQLSCPREAEKVDAPRRECGLAPDNQEVSIETQVLGRQSCGLAFTTSCRSCSFAAGTSSRLKALVGLRTRTRLSIESLHPHTLGQKWPKSACQSRLFGRTLRPEPGRDDAVVDLTGQSPSNGGSTQARTP